MLHNFKTIGDGLSPSTRVTQTPDGTIYGVTRSGGNGGTGTIFKITPAGEFKTIYNFGSHPGAGVTPSGALALGPDNAVYGTTEGGGANDRGTVYRIGSSDAVTTIHSFGAAAARRRRIRSNRSRLRASFMFSKRSPVRRRTAV